MNLVEVALVGGERLRLESAAPISLEFVSDRDQIRVHGDLVKAVQWSLVDGLRTEGEVTLHE